MRTVALISCGKSKQRIPCRASDLYTGTYFKSLLAYAKRYFFEIYILSAKYGLVELEKVIAPYEQRLTDMSTDKRTQWNATVAMAIRCAVPPPAHLVFLTGRAYRKRLVPLLVDNYKISTPLEGLGGIGKQLAFLRRKI